MKIPGISGRKSAGGFTLIEMLISVSVMTIVIVGTFDVFVQTIRSYNETSLMSMSEKRASLALDRMVIGVGTNYGLREAAAASVIATNLNGTDWKLSYSNQNSFLYFKYNAGTTNAIFDQSGKLICTNVISSTLINLTNGCKITVTVAESGGGRILTNAMNTFVEYRN
jgi:prepilin-type N-terminal cleavage/methylation domain-containing protein